MQCSRVSSSLHGLGHLLQERSMLELCVKNHDWRWWIGEASQQSTSSSQNPSAVTYYTEKQNPTRKCSWEKGMFFLGMKTGQAIEIWNVLHNFCYAPVYVVDSFELHLFLVGWKICESEMQLSGFLLQKNDPVHRLHQKKYDINSYFAWTKTCQNCWTNSLKPNQKVPSFTHLHTPQSFPTRHRQEWLCHLPASMEACPKAGGIFCPAKKQHSIMLVKLSLQMSFKC